MSTSPSIPSSLVPGKDPPQAYGTSSKEITAPQISDPIPPTPSSSITSPSQTTRSKTTIRNSPLRQTTSSSILPTSSQQNPDQIEQEAPFKRPPFTPFFTLIHDPTTNTTHHPSRIHYIFSDDEDNTDLLTSACVRSLHASSPSTSQEQPQKSQTSETTSSSSSSATFRNSRNKRPHRREERVVVVDVNEKGDGIVNAASLSSSWQILNAAVENAPTWGGAEQASEEERGLMLKIEGVSSAGLFEGEGLGIAGKSSLLGDEEMQVLMEGFDRKMTVLRKIVSAGEGLVVGNVERMEIGEKGEKREQEEEAKEESKDV